MCVSVSRKKYGVPPPRAVTEVLRRDQSGGGATRGVSGLQMHCLPPSEVGVGPSQQESAMTLEIYAPGAKGLLVNVSGDWAASPPGNRAEVLPVRRGPGRQAGMLSVYFVQEYPYSI
jgi:hypothetical protein